MSDPTPAAEHSATIRRIGDIIQSHQSFLLLSHVRPDGDAIGSQIALGCSLIAIGKTVHLVNEDGLPENLAFLAGSHLVTPPPVDPIGVDVVFALDNATESRLGEAALKCAADRRILVNIDHHVSNTRYGDVNLIDPTSPATGQILYELITALGMPLPPESRDAIYVAISTDTGSFQYPATTARTYEIAAGLIRRGLDVGAINSKTYDEHPYRRLELMRALLNTLELSADGLVAHWDLRERTRVELALRPEDSEGLIDTIRAIRGVQVALFFEELPGDEGKIRVSMRSKDRRIDVCRIALEFGGGGHALAAGIRMPGPLEAAKARVLDAVRRAVDSAFTD
ncbi:MAG: bifunctional oligoribonuclease/PAP phosphatase NrnA [Verrucomicrobia bacterium]|nr:bifunctional oligoribonuclease/PAP phosphatase NrnA [Verrucomicrobiota bacterium]